MGLFGPNIKRLSRDRDIPGLVEALGHRNTKVRLAAVEAFYRAVEKGKVGTLVTSLGPRTLLSLLDHEDKELRAMASETLALLYFKDDSGTILRMLLSFLEKDDTSGKAEILATFSRVVDLEEDKGDEFLTGEGLVFALFEVAKSRDESLRYRSSWLLSHMAANYKGPMGVEVRKYLAEAFMSDDPALGAAALSVGMDIKCLDHCEEVFVEGFLVKPFLHYLGHAGLEQRRLAVELLSLLCNELGGCFLAPRVVETGGLEILFEAMRSGDEELRDRAVVAFGRMSEGNEWSRNKLLIDGPGLRALVAALDDKHRLVREQAAKALQSLNIHRGDPLVEELGLIPWLMVLLNDESMSVRRSVVWILGNMRVLDARPVLKEMSKQVEDEELLPELRKALAYFRLAELEDTRELIRLLEAKDTTARLRVLAELAWRLDSLEVAQREEAVKGGGVKAALCALSDPDKSVRELASRIPGIMANNDLGVALLGNGALEEIIRQLPGSKYPFNHNLILALRKLSCSEAFVRALDLETARELVSLLEEMDSSSWLTVVDFFGFLSENGGAVVLRDAGVLLKIVEGLVQHFQAVDDLEREKVALALRSIADPKTEILLEQALVQTCSSRTEDVLEGVLLHYKSK